MIRSIFKYLLKILRWSSSKYPALRFDTTLSDAREEFRARVLRKKKIKI